MAVEIIVKSPREEHLHDQEDQYGRDVVLHRQDVGPMSIIEQAPKDCHQGVQNRDAAIEGKLWDLCGGQLSKGIAELHNCLIVGPRVFSRKDAIVSGVLDRIVKWLRILEIHDLGVYNVVGLLVNVGRDDVFAQMGLVTIAGTDVFGVTDGEFLQRMILLACIIHSSARPKASSAVVLENFKN